MSVTGADPAANKYSDAMAQLPPREVQGIPLIDERNSPASDRTPPVVRTTRGSVRGFWRGSCATFTGTPYAAPPVGALAFRAPRPHERWDGVRDAVHQGATPQRGRTGVTLIPEPSVPGDSPLNVNVFTPSPDPAAKLPVLVYIHGGAYAAGSIASPWYDGASFARDGVVTVTLSYRLAFPGFGWVPGSEQNRGVRDWIAALEWVRENIAAFGGDPDRVTIAGQSAGGGAVLTLLGIPETHDLFHAAWCMSPTLSLVDRHAALALSEALAAALGVENTAEGLGSVPPRELGRAQKPLVAGSRSLAGIRQSVAGGLRIGPTIDGELIDRPTISAIRAGSGSAIPLVIGSTDDEFTMVLDPYARLLRWVPASLALALIGFRGERAHAWRAGYPRTGGAARLLGQYATDMGFRRHVRRVGDARRAANTWGYRFAWPSPVSGWALHCLDVPFFFDVLRAPGVARVAGEDPPQELADEIHGSAVEFITTHALRRATWPAAAVFDTPPTSLDDAYADARTLG
ncbi:carboxylic ester hydrolase [Microbacterium nanhaiense]|uniref:Carboxylic ester hydrolase n=1 Tax=Microbacterium nanhaiense TaxID=1301026 RepID=A0ABQ2N1L3_9MICO|nr:carboxylesterase family protein [Microbacterium nanhaiense]GGO63371.1 carboxylic ester hydrolase [Microbacterium nanhaiense]